MLKEGRGDGTRVIVLAKGCESVHAYFVFDSLSCRPSREVSRCCNVDLAVAFLDIPSSRPQRLEA
eukprot:4600641-Pleurochrysis_carterae.AAC.1